MSWIVAIGRVCIFYPKMMLELLSHITYYHDSKNQKSEFQIFHDFLTLGEIARDRETKVSQKEYQNVRPLFVYHKLKFE